jgi:O-antigen/teichoic acid export membrane protein
MDGEDDAVEGLSAHSTEVARGSVWSLLGSFFFKFVSFLYVVLIARAAAQDDIGLFYLSLAIVTFPIVLSDLGLPASLLRYASFYEGKGEGAKVRDLLRYTYWAVIGLGIVFVVLLWLLADTLGSVYQNPRLPDAIRILSLFLLLNNIFRANYSLIQGLADIRRMQFVVNLDNVLKLVLSGLFFWFLGPSFWSLVAGFLLAHCLVVLVSLLFVTRKTVAIPATGKPLVFSQFLGEVLPFGLMLSAVYSFYLILSSSDRILLGYLSNPADATTLVAIYAISLTLASVLTMFPASIGAVFLPVMSRLAGRGDLASMRSTMGTAQRWLMLITLPVAVFMMLFPGELLGAFYGADYAGGALAMAIFTLGVLVNSFSYLTAFALAALRMVRLELKVVSISAVINIALCVLLIPRFGMEGAALASLISFTAMTVLFRHYGWKLFRFAFPAETPKILLAGLLTFILALVLKPMAALSYDLAFSQVSGLLQPVDKFAYLAFLAFLALATACIFLGLALLLKCFRREDVSLLGKIMRRAMAPQPLAALALRIASYGVAVPK